MTEKYKRFEIDVEGTTQENALFKGDEFICYADDVETIIEKLNELNDENETLKLQDNDRKGYNKKLMHKLDSLSGLWVTDQQVSENDKKKYHMWRLE